MDELAKFNKARWEALAAANVAYSRPMLDLDPAAARQVVDPYGIMGEVAGKDVLCLAGGGGQQSAAFALLGANVTVVDISETQLERDRIALAHYGLNAHLVQGDMRDLSQFSAGAFDVVWHAFSISFVPDSGQVFDQVRRGLRPGGLYHLAWHNPFTMGIDENTWNGEGYLLKHIYRDGEVALASNVWDFTDENNVVHRVEGPREFRHTLSTVVNGLIGRGFTLLGLWEDMAGDPNAEPGSWEHYLAVAPLGLVLWARLTNPSLPV